MTDQHQTSWRVAVITGQPQRSSTVVSKLERGFSVSSHAPDRFEPSMTNALAELVIVNTDVDPEAAITKLRAPGQAPAIPVMVLAKTYTPGAEARMLALGASDYLMADVDAWVLCDRVRSRIESHRYRRRDPHGSEPSPELSALREALFEHSPLTISVRALDGRYLLANPAAGKFLGTDPQDFWGKRPEQTPGFGQQIERHDAIVRTRRESVEYERTFQTPAGEKHIRIVAFPILDSTGELQAIGRIGAEITPGRQGEGPHIESIRALSRQEAMFAAFLDNAPNGMTIRDLQGRYLMVNAVTAERLDRSKAEILGRTNAQLGRFSEATREEIATQETTVIESRAAFTQRRWEAASDGQISERWVTKFPLFDTDGTVYSVATVDLDVTALGETERALMEREENFSSLVQGSIQGIAIRRGMKPLFINQAFAEIHGYESADELMALPDLSTLIAPHDRARLQSIAERRQRGQPVPHRYEYQASRKDGATVTLQCVVSTTHWQGLPAIQMAVIDISDQRAAHLELHAGRQRFQDFAEASSDWFWEMGPDLKLVSVSEQGAGPLSAQAVDWLAASGRNRGGVSADTSLQDRWRGFWSLVRGHQPVRNLELPFRDASGDIRHIRISAKERRAADGSFDGYRGVGSDITDVVRSRRQAELLREAIDASNDGTVLYDENLSIVFTNRRFHRIFDMLPPQREITGMTREALLRVIASGRVRAGALSEKAAEQYVQRKLQAAGRDTPRSYEHTHSDGRTYLERYSDAGDGGLMLQMQDITEAKAAEAKLNQYQAQLRQLASEVSLAEESERRRIATELHDGAVQNLGLARIKLGSMSAAAEGTVSSAQLRELTELLAQSIRELRSLMSELSPPMLYELGLAPAVQWLAQRMNEQYGLDCEVAIDGEPGQLPVELSVLLFQSVRELLMNVVKHAQASQAEVIIGCSKGQLEVVVADDGQGMNQELAESHPSSYGGFGLFNVRERLGLIGGGISIESTSGTRVTLNAPIEAAEAGAGG